MNKHDYTGWKVGFSIMGGFILDCLGGWDNLLALVISLIGVDILSGLFKAIKNRNVSSAAMREGLCKKAMIIFIISIAVQGDKVIMSTYGHPIIWNNTHELYLRTAFLLWFGLEEAISILENCDEIGVPLPKWLKQILVQVNDSITETAPSTIIEYLSKALHITLPSEHTHHKIESIEGLEDSGNDNTSLDEKDA